jgi:hypothetical protein
LLAKKLQKMGIAVDASGNAYLTRFTQSADFPISEPDPRSLSGKLWQRLQSRHLPDQSGAVA